MHSIVEMAAEGYENGVTLDFSRPGKPTDKAFVESFNGHVRDECLNAHWFLSMTDARAKSEAWRRDYNESRPYIAWLDHPGQICCCRTRKSDRMNAGNSTSGWIRNRGTPTRRQK